MKFLVIQERGGQSAKPYVDVARVAHAADAILFAASLLKASPSRGHVQVYRVFRRHYAYCLLAASPGSPGSHYLDAEIKQALDTHQTKEKIWRAEERKRKGSLELGQAFLARFEPDNRLLLLKDKSFGAAAFATPIQEDAALTRAAEMGILPVCAEGKAVAR